MRRWIACARSSWILVLCTYLFGVMKALEVVFLLRYALGRLIRSQVALAKVLPKGKAARWACTCEYIWVYPPPLIPKPD